MRVVADRCNARHQFADNDRKSKFVTCPLVAGFQGSRNIFDVVERGSEYLGWIPITLPTAIGKHQDGGSVAKQIALIIQSLSAALAA